MAELADALDLGSSVNRREGSSPFTRTTSRQAFMACRVFFTENTAALYRLPLLYPKKSCDFSGALFLIIQSSLCFDVLFSKNVCTCSLASPLS